MFSSNTKQFFSWLKKIIILRPTLCFLHRRVQLISGEWNSEVFKLDNRRNNESRRTTTEVHNGDLELPTGKFWVWRYDFSPVFGIFELVNVVWRYQSTCNLAQKMSEEFAFKFVPVRNVDNEHVPTISSKEQFKVEQSVEYKYKLSQEAGTFCNGHPVLLRQGIVKFLKNGLQHLSRGHECLDASRPWLCYWILHSLELLNEPISEEHKAGVVKFLAKCQDPAGGFAGGPGQMPHLAPTYAAVSALVIVGTQEAYEIINRPALENFLMRCRIPGGGFVMHEGGEIDVRGAYCAAVVASILHLNIQKVLEDTADWVIRCQTYEGGFGGCPGMEAHGGYTFCGFAALCVINKEHMCDLKALLRWVCSRQMNFEGGFQGRTNKLVDGCYSFWQGGIIPLIQRALGKQSDTCVGNYWLFHQEALQDYLLMCCQHLNPPVAGLIDKPGKPPDFYHTCYGLSGLSIAQHFTDKSVCRVTVKGDPSNELVPTHPLFNISFENLANAEKYFSHLPASAR